MDYSSVGFAGALKNPDNGSKSCVMPFRVWLSLVILHGPVVNLLQADMGKYTLGPRLKKRRTAPASDSGRECAV